MYAHDELAASPLGHRTSYPDAYDASQLFAVPRAAARAEIGVTGTLPFTGVDVWNAYELTWLDARGKPRVAIATIEVPASSSCIVESKSVKLYLGSFAQSRFDHSDRVVDAIARDVSAAVGEPVRVALRDVAADAGHAIGNLAGESLDELPVDCAAYEIDASLLASSGDVVRETLHTHLFRSVCPVTGQPDYGSVQIDYRGPRIDRASLLRYLVSYRRHAGFHEHCVERIFVDIRARCGAESLAVLARFTRRGGVDINPFRADSGTPWPRNIRTPRQ